MRTTITLDDRLLAQLKERAAESGTSVSRLVEQARCDCSSGRGRRLAERTDSSS
ncbi:MAG: ribbon-helix-helix protein, CopG family [Acidobacteriota bacterium]